jgi:regulator of cell morphogenesis and NO signaling
MDKSSAKPSVHEEFTLDEEQIGEPFHRFLALKATDFPAAVKCFAEFKSAISRRIRWEEEKMFPEFLQRVGGDLESTCADLRQEHREVVKLLDAIEAKLNCPNPATEVEEAALQKLLVAHNHREHSVVFPALE